LYEDPSREVREDDGWRRRGWDDDAMRLKQFPVLQSGSGSWAKSLPGELPMSVAAAMLSA
jgi:hypothetical protein